jgi:hypothetical protein
MSYFDKEVINDTSNAIIKIFNDFFYNRFYNRFYNKINLYIHQFFSNSVK